MNVPDDRSASAHTAYPDSMLEREAAHIRKRRGLDDGSEIDVGSLVGVALSGGGIRSATFCLGIFQGLAKLRLLERIDILSTVSGGGYFGAFYGRLFNRPQITDLEDVRALLRPDLHPSIPDDRLSRGKVFHYLRENGRYLAPSGAGDLILGGAVVLRNWVSIHAVLFTFALMVIQLLQLIRVGGHLAAGDTHWSTFEKLLAQSLPFGDSWLWWSPYIAIAGAVFVLAVVPFGWAYWMIDSRHEHRDKADKSRSARRLATYVDPRIGLALAIVLLACGAWYWRAVPGPLVGLACLAISGVITFLIQIPYLGIKSPHQLANARRGLSDMLKNALMVFASVLAFVLVDTLGQTLYVLWLVPGHDALSAWLAGVVGGLAALGAGARRIAVFAGARSGTRLQVPLQLVAWVAAVLLYLGVLTITDAVSHGVAWNFEMPAHAPEKLACLGAADRCTGGVARIGLENLVITALAVLALGLVSWVFGRNWPFLNRSTLHALYSARLTRAYLGASNACRVDPARARAGEPCKAGGAKASGDAVTVSTVIDGDDVSLEGYYGLSPGDEGNCAPFPKGAPLHIINVTVNETIDGQSQIQRLDRKGFGLAVGPAGFSAGVRHHAVRAASGGWDVHPPGSGPEAFRVFEQWRNGHAGEPLLLGAWSGISGAAVSTGIGSRTHLGFSLLAGFFNIRTGYWWDSDVEPESRLEGAAARGSWSARALAAAFPVQAYLLDEFLSSFHGSGRRWWYLSDGGHFENMGGYELIRRRLPLMIIIDAEADPDYRFEGLSGLVLKARLDFGAEIEFLDADRLGGALDRDLAPYFGTLDMLRRGPWREDRVPEILGGGKNPSARVATWRERHEPGSSERARHSLAHAALARVTYADEPDRCSCLVYVKATLLGDEPADVTHYHAENNDFPQQTTADQFFDEAQWEGYRKLGQLIAERVFARGLKPFEDMRKVLRPSGDEK